MMLPDDLRPWDQQPRETAKQFHAFGHYQSLPLHERSTDRAWRLHKEKCEGQHVARTKRAHRTWHEWCAAWGWIERCAAWEREVDRAAREKVLKDQTDARVRHARMAQATMSALTVPSRAVLEALQDPAVMANMIGLAKKNTKAFVKLIDLVSWSARGLPGLVTVERLALGLSTEQVEIDDVRADETGLNIPQDPESMDLALELLSRLSKQQAPLARMGDDEEPAPPAAKVEPGSGQ